MEGKLAKGRMAGGGGRGVGEREGVVGERGGGGRGGGKGREKGREKRREKGRGRGKFESLSEPFPWLGTNNYFLFCICLLKCQIASGLVPASMSAGLQRM